MTLRSLLSALLATILAAGVVPAAAASKVLPPASTSELSAPMRDLLDYVRNHNTTGFLVMQADKVLVEKNWPAPENGRQFSIFVHGRNAWGELLEDVASQQKSFVAVLIAIAMDKGLIDINKPVSAYIGEGWSKATRDQEQKIRVVDVLTMSSGLNDQFEYVAPPGTVFHYNTPVYAMIKRILPAAASEPLDTITREWLTEPAGMKETSWRQRPAALASVGNNTGLVTTPRDTARLGRIILNNGVAESGQRIVSEENLKAMFTRSAANPAYGWLWWLNGSDFSIRIVGRTDGPLIPAAPADTIAALGFLDRRLYIVPSRKLIVVRTGAATGAKDFDEQLWTRLMKVIE